MPQRLDKTGVARIRDGLAPSHGVLLPGLSSAHCRSLPHHSVFREHVPVSRRIADTPDHLIFPDGVAAMKRSLLNG